MLHPPLPLWVGVNSTFRLPQSYLGAGRAFVEIGPRSPSRDFVIGRRFRMDGNSMRPLKAVLRRFRPFSSTRTGGKARPKPPIHPAFACNTEPLLLRYPG